MNRLHDSVLRMVFIICTLSILSSCDKEKENQPTTLEEKIDRYLSQNQREDNPGLSIAVRKDGNVVYRGNAGVARSINNGLKIDAETQFRIGSISKPFTAIAILKLVEENKLQLDDKLLSFYPDLPQAYENITIEHLLAHRSGLLDYIDDNTDISSLDNLKTRQVPDIIEGSGLENLNFEAGTAGRYSNTGYVFLALIIEKVTGITYPAYLEQIIFDPIGMDHSFVISETDHLGDHGDNYALSFGTKLEVSGFNSLIYGASGVVSTTNEMMLFVEALLNYEIIRKESLSLMTQTRGVVPNIQTDYGLGWMTGTGDYWHTGFITDPNDFWHSGGFDGYRTVLSINPDLNLQVIILSNGGEPTKDKMWDILELTRMHYK